MSLDSKAKNKDVGKGMNMAKRILNKEATFLELISEFN